LGIFDFGDKEDRRSKVASIRDKQRKERLQLNRDIKETARKERRAELQRKQLESRTATARAEERMYEAKLKRKQAKRAASPFPTIHVPTPSLKKKKQGKKLSRKKRITLL